MTISSLDSDLHDLRERNNHLTENNNLLQIREEVTEERHRAKLEEVVEKAKMVGPSGSRKTPSRGIPKQRQLMSGSRPRAMM